MCVCRGSFWIPLWHFGVAADASDLMNALSICCSSALEHQNDTGLISRRNSLDWLSVTYRKQQSWEEVKNGKEGMRALVQKVKKKKRERRWQYEWFSKRMTGSWVRLVECVPQRTSWQTGGTFSLTPITRGVSFQQLIHGIQGGRSSVLWRFTFPACCFLHKVMDDATVLLIRVCLNSHKPFGVKLAICLYLNQWIVSMWVSL